MPIKNKQYNKEYQKEWSYRKRHGLSTKNIFPVLERPYKPQKLTLEERKLHQKEANKKRKLKLKTKLDNLMGTQCFICNSNQSLMTHEIYGVAHNGDGSNKFTDAFERPQDFVRLCYSCHKGVHWVMKWFNISWDDIIKKIENNQ